ncbi:MAG TPA: hypothetical protein VEH84_07005 [Alphaproteobacteria bacterium]|nr:hypothetical protein [Alphaproteobacteria bacterium]
MAEPNLNKTEARQGVSNQNVRWVLLCGLVLVVICFAILFGIFAA